MVRTVSEIYQYVFIRNLTDNNLTLLDFHRDFTPYLFSGYTNPPTVEQLAIEFFSVFGFAREFLNFVIEPDVTLNVCSDLIFGEDFLHDSSDLLSESFLNTELPIIMRRFILGYSYNDYEIRPELIYEI